MNTLHKAFAALMTPVLFALGCGRSTPGDDSGRIDGPTIAVTTDILGDVVSNMVGDTARVEVVIPTGSSPHDFQPSAEQAAAIRSADVLVTNGAGFEAALADAISAAEADGVMVCTAIDGVGVLETGHPATVDPHFFTDPARMSIAIDHLAGCITRVVPDLEHSGFEQHLAAYSDEITALDAEVEKILAIVPEHRRLLVTDHQVFTYFADRYDFTVPGTIITSTGSQADAESLRELAALVKAEGIPAVFADASSPHRLVETLASEAGGVKVVSLFSETLGPDGADTYVGMMRTNAQRIAGALQ